MKALRLAAAVLAIAVLGGLLAACSPADRLEVRAVFDDVADLTIRGAVKVADVPVGRVTDISLTDDLRAMVTMRLDSGVALPVRVRAELRKTSVLGERYVRLIPDPESGGSFESGDVIAETRFVPELEELVGGGSQLLAAVSVDHLAGAIEAGATGLAGRGQTLRTLLDDLGVIIGAYAHNAEDFVRLIDGLDAFLADVGPQADLHGQAFAELARAARVLSEEDERLMDALASARSLASNGADIIRTHRQRMDRFFVQFSAVLREITQYDAELDGLFKQLHKHNHNTIRGVHLEHAQVLLDFIVCGMNDDPSSEVRSCGQAPQGKPRPEPREPGGWR